jgi:kynurenine formamidase
VAQGKSICDCSIDEFIFNNPLIVDVQLTDEQNLQIDQLQKYSSNLMDCDILLIKTGFNRYRTTDIERYIWKTPGVSIDTAKWLVDNAPNLRAIGLDFLSFETLSDTSHNSAAHIIVLSNGIKIIEDMNLDTVANEKPNRIFVIPLFIEGLDSFHATVFAEV